MCGNWWTCLGIALSNSLGNKWNRLSSPTSAHLYIICLSLCPHEMLNTAAFPSPWKPPHLAQQARTQAQGRWRASCWKFKSVISQLENTNLPWVVTFIGGCLSAADHSLSVKKNSCNRSIFSSCCPMYLQQKHDRSKPMYFFYCLLLVNMLICRK